MTTITNNLNKPLSSPLDLGATSASEQGEHLRLPYRAEIDGLRAIAVWAVLLFHAGFGSASGGFIGVDVFFVISGYLIGHDVLQLMLRGQFSFSQFYQRRVLRLLPALLLVLSISLPLAAVLLLPSHRVDYQQSLLAVLLMASNVLFFLESGYFNTAAELKPLLHTWSLSLEEQFYLLLPLLLLCCRKGLAPRYWLILLLGVAVASLALCLWLTTVSQPAAFYLLPSRAWQFLAGVLLAGWHLQHALQRHGAGSTRANDSAEMLFLWGVTALNPRPWLRQSVACAALLVLIIACISLNANQAYPGAYAILPTLAALLLLAFATDQTWLGRCLQQPVLRWFGLLSYSAYLWHHLLFAFARHAVATELSQLSYFALILCSWLFAWGTFHWIEQPFRGRGPRAIPRPRALAITSSWLVLLLGIALLVQLEWGRGAFFSSAVKWDSLQARLEQQGPVCKLQPLSAPYHLLQACDFGDLNAAKTIVLYGDSHAVAMMPQLNQVLKQQQVRGVRLIIDGCPLIAGVYEVKQVTNSAVCEQAFRQFQQLLQQQSADLFVALRWTFRLYPISGAIEHLLTRNQAGAAERLPFEHYAVVLDPQQRTSIAADDKAAAVEAFLSQLRSSSRRLYLVTPIPEQSWDIAKINQLANYGWLSQSAFPAPLQLGITVAEYQHRNRFILPILRRYADAPDVTLINSEKVFCQDLQPGRCIAQRGETIYYLDDDHVSDEGTALLLRDLKF